MCSICGSYPCLSRCPNAEEPPTRGYCIQCKGDLREDYEYYTDNENNEFCSEECAKEYYGIKIREWDYE